MLSNNITRLRVLFLESTKINYITNYIFKTTFFKIKLYVGNSKIWSVKAIIMCFKCLWFC